MICSNAARIISKHRTWLWSIILFATAAVAIATYCFRTYLLARAERFEIEGTPPWSRDFTYEYGPESSFCLGGVYWLTPRLTGAFRYKNISTHPITLVGTRENEWAFWPNATLQVAAKERRQWKTISKSVGAGIPTELTIRENELAVLNVDITAFQQFITKLTFGRVVLATGENAEFELSRLTPPLEYEPTPPGWKPSN